MTSFDPLKHDLGGQKLHHKEFIYTPTHNQNFSFLSGPGAEITGGGASGAPPRRIPNFFLPAGNRVNVFLTAHVNGFTDSANRAKISVFS